MISIKSKPIFALLVLAIGVLIASCGSDGGGAAEDGGGGGESAPPTSITNGSISGLSFMVTSGEVFQDTADGPITAGSTEASIVFDTLLLTLTGTPGVARIEVAAGASPPSPSGIRPIASPRGWPPGSTA